MKRENVYTEIRKRHITISTSSQVLQYLRPSTRVLTAKYSSTDKEVLAVCCSVCVSTEVYVSSPQSVATRNLSNIFSLCPILKFPSSLTLSLQCASAAKANRFMNFRHKDWRRWHYFISGSMTISSNPYERSLTSAC